MALPHLIKINVGKELSNHLPHKVPSITVDGSPGTAISSIYNAKPTLKQHHRHGPINVYSYTVSEYLVFSDISICTKTVKIITGIKSYC